MTSQELYTKDHLAQLLKVHPRTIDKYVKLGMPVIKIGDLPRFDYEDVIDWLKKREEMGGGEK